MPLISRIGRRHFRTRMLILGIYMLLCAGGLTMVYPFGLMIAGSTKSEVDQKEFQLLPRFLTDEVVLYRKFVQSLMNEDLHMLRMAYGAEIVSFEAVQPPETDNVVLVEAWDAFVRRPELSAHVYALGHLIAPLSRAVLPEMLRHLIASFHEESGGDLDVLNQTYGTQFLNWHAIDLVAEQYLLRQDWPSEDRFHQRLRRFKQQNGPEHRYYFSADGYYRATYLASQYGRRIDAYNDSHGTAYVSYDKVPLARRVPANDAARRDWEPFVRDVLNLRWIWADRAAGADYRAFLVAKYGSIKAINRNYGTTYGAIDAIPLPETAPETSLPRSDWDLFIRGWADPDTGSMHAIAVEHLIVDSLDAQFREFLRQRFKTLDALNAEAGTTYATFDDIAIPQQAAHYAAFKQRVGAWRWEFATRNYRTVTAYMLRHGRAIFNTVVYCGLAVLTALLVNPMAAYALSRFQLPSAYKVLLFLMLTMAFPQMVNQIPQFLMLREFGMLNTYWALILPGLAHGYSIFILKGFFDSQPRELYESAAIDGANEWTIFWRITMSLSKPVLAYIALFAFTGAYSNFIFAMLICQDERMWTLMPMLYQLQQRAGQGVVFASLIVAAIPTFLVFLFAQNVIMRGIVVPVEK